MKYTKHQHLFHQNQAATKKTREKKNTNEDKQNPRSKEYV